MSERYTIARMTLEGNHFEILVKPELAFSYRSGKPTAILNILVTETIFSDANKGLRAAEESLQKAFGTKDSIKIANIILDKGTLQLTTEQRKQMVEEKRRQILTFISRQCIDPKTKLPHPPLRIKQAMEQIHFSVDPFKEIEEQAREIVKLLRPILPLRIEQVSVAVNVPPEHSSKAYGTVKRYGVIKQEKWESNGSWSAIVEMPAGLYGPFLEKLGKLTQGSLEAKLVK